MAEYLKFKIESSFPVSVEKIYKAWLDSKLHSEMTGAEANCTSEIGEGFSAWDGYISGRNLELISNRKIIQSWRTTDFKDGDNDSLIEINLKDTGKGCALTLEHSKIPPGLHDYKEGWEEYYFQPMREYFKKS